jgi:hypothetical protein
MSTWDRLSPKRQLEIALAVARRRGKRLQQAYPNVVSVGAGYRTRRQQDLPTDEVCLRFLVHRKWRSSKRRGDAIPRFVRTRVGIRGKTRVLDIPTDVTEFRFGEPQLALPLTAGITARHEGKARDHGSACCMVCNVASPAERYLLSCYHLFSPVMNELPGAIDCIDADGGAVIGPLLEIADPDGPRVALDAALASVTLPDVDRFSIWDRAPVTRATDAMLDALDAGASLFVSGRRLAPAVGDLPAAARHGPLPARFQSRFPNAIPFDYRRSSGRIFRFADTLQYIAAVRPGDSGAAVMDGLGTLYGMHFYGQGNVGFALSAPRLFDPDVFPFDIELC